MLNEINIIFFLCTIGGDSLVGSNLDGLKKLKGIKSVDTNQIRCRFFILIFFNFIFFFFLKKIDITLLRSSLTW